MWRLHTDIEKPEHIQMKCFTCKETHIFNHPERYENWGKVFYRYYPDATLSGTIKSIAAPEGKHYATELGTFTCAECKKYMLNKSKV